MDLYGKEDKSIPQKLVIVFMEIIFLAIAAWILFYKYETNYYRSILNLSFSIIVFVRINTATFVWLKRRIPWEEAFSIPFAFALYYIGFAYLGAKSTQSIDFWDIIAILIFLFGSYLNTSGEYKRYIWKKNPQNKGKLYTQGLFKYSMHINYFGDLLWVTGYAILTKNIYSVIIVLILFAFFQFYNIPKLDQYLAEKYGEQFQLYKQKTKSFIPFII